MRRFLGALAILLVPASAIAADDALPEWAYPPGARPAERDQDPTPVSVPGSTKTYTRAQIADPFGPPDWFPDEHPALPDIVAHGRKPTVRACISCHLASGAGHPESANISGANAAYFQRQLLDMQSGARKSPRGNGLMWTMAKAMSQDEIKAAAEYFSHTKPVKWMRVVETATVVKTYFPTGGMRFAMPGGGTEPLGRRIIEIPENDAGALARDPHSGFVAYVPAGSLARGEALANTGGAGKTIACGVCHGPDLKGLGDVPRIGGLSPSYIFRQLHDIQSGHRNGTSAALMKAVVAKLSPDDMIDIAAYVSSRTP